MKKPILFLFLLLTFTRDVLAQCAMCKSAAESNMNAGGNIGSGLNSGILYMLALVYTILCSGIYFFFRKQINKRLRRLKNRLFPQNT